MRLTIDELNNKFNSDEKFLIKFYSDNCAPCKVMDQFYHESQEILKSENIAVNLYSINIKDCMDLLSELGIRSVPTTMSYSGGQLIGRISGLIKTDKILEMAKEL